MELTPLSTLLPFATPSNMYCWRNFCSISAPTAIWDRLGDIAAYTFSNRCCNVLEPALRVVFMSKPGRTILVVSVRTTCHADKSAAFRTVIESRMPRLAARAAESASQAITLLYLLKRTSFRKFQRCSAKNNLELNLN